MSNKAIFITVVTVLAIAEWTLSAETITAANYDSARTRYNGDWDYPGDELASNVYSKVKSLYEGHWQTPFDHFLGVRGGGLYQEMDSQKILPLANIVSNNIDAIVSDWATYETNEMVRFTTICAIAYSGMDNYTNFVGRILAGYDADANFCGWPTVSFAFFPYGTVSEDTLEMNYDAPAVSNIILRMRAIAVSRNDDNLRQRCDYLISGESKRETLELKAAGAL